MDPSEVERHARIQEFSSGGVQVNLTKKALTTFFFFFFLVLSLFYRSQMVNFKEIYHFSRFQRGSNIFQGGGGGSNFFQGGSNCLFPIETHITCDFPGGGGGGGGSRDALSPPLDRHLREPIRKQQTQFCWVCSWKPDDVDQQRLKEGMAMWTMCL